MQITDTFKNFDFSKIELPDFDVPKFDVPNFDMDAANERFERFGQTAVTNYTETNDRILDAVVDTNRSIVDFAVKTADSVVDAVDNRFADAPLADRIPTPAEAGKAYIEFVERAADFNRDLNKRVVDMLPSTVQPATKAAAKPAAKKAPAKPAAKKAAAKKRTAKPAAKKAAATK